MDWQEIYESIWKYGFLPNTHNTFQKCFWHSIHQKKSEMHWKLQKPTKQTTTMTKKNEKDMST